MGAGRTDHPATVEQQEGGPEPLVRSEDFCDTL